MRTTDSTSGTTGKTRGTSLTTTLAAVALALPMSGLFGATAFASATAPAAASDKAEHGKASAPGQDKKADASVATTSSSASSTSPAANQNTTTTPFVNQGGVTTGSNTTKYEVVNGRDGSPAKGGGQPSGDVQQRQPFSTADQNNTGANDTSATNPYRSTRDGAPSLNGNGGGKQVGQPCAGCVGKADNKNPAGQAPGGSDHNAGYECDRNHGIGRSNPAHTACTTGTTPRTPVVCAAGTHMVNGSCVTDTKTPVVCAAGTHMVNGSCVTDTKTPDTCAAGSHMVKGTCVTDTKTPGTKTPDTCANGSAMPANGTCDTTGTVLNSGSKNDKLPICHATGSSTNPYVFITPNKNGVYNGHGKHGDDIVPPYSYNDHGTKVNVIGQNWTAANQAIFHNGCSAPATPVVCASGSTMVNGTCQAPATTPTTPVLCAEGAMVGPIVPRTTRPGCSIQGDNGGAAAGPSKAVSPARTPAKAPAATVIAQGSQPQPVMGAIAGAAAAPAVVRARPTALPFTGGNAGLLAEGAALMLLLGGGLVFAARKKAVTA